MACFVQVQWTLKTSGQDALHTMAGRSGNLVQIAQNPLNFIKTVGFKEKQQKWTVLYWKKDRNSCPNSTLNDWFLVKTNSKLSFLNSNLIIKRVLSNY
jgi:hypothetical protein